MLLYFFLVSTCFLCNTFHTFHWKWSQYRWQKLGLKSNEADGSHQFEFAFSIIILPTRPAERQCRGLTKSSIRMRVIPSAPAYSIQQGTPHPHNFNSLHTERDPTGQWRPDPLWAACFLHRLAAGGDHVTFRVHLTTIFLSVPQLHLPYSSVSLIPISYPLQTVELTLSYQWNLKKLIFVSQTICIFFNNCFAYSRFLKTDILSLFNQQINCLTHQKEWGNGVKHQV